MTGMILVPIKDPARAKSRLSDLLTAPERSLLAWAMLEDLISVLEPLPWPVAFVTSSERAAARAAGLGYRVLWEGGQISESASVDAASRILKGEGVDAVLRLPADIPLAKTGDVEELLAQPVAAPCAILVPSWNRMGTNALLRMPPDLFPSRFGKNSFERHFREAAAVGAQVRIVENVHLALDIDDPTDVARFLAQPVEGETRRLLGELNVSRRLRHHVNL